MRSGPFSWTNSAFFTAVAKSAANFRFDCDASGARPNLLSAGQAASTKCLSDASASGATSVATTSKPFARKSAAQLAPTTLVPIIATVLIDFAIDFVLSDWLELQISAYATPVRLPCV